MSSDSHIIEKVSEHAIPIIICFDNNYCLSGAALINSIIRNSDPIKTYDIVILENKITDINKQRIVDLANNHKNISIRFFDANTLPEIKSAFTRAHFSAVTYARLYIPKLFQKYEKVIFIDSDTVVRSDLAQLMSIDLGQYLVAAVKDIVMEGYIKFKVKSTTESGGLDAGLYLQNILKMKNEKYLQAGLVIFNISQILKEKKDLELISNIGTFQFWFLDQDILNKVFNDRVKYLPLEWNVYHGNGNTNGFFPYLNSTTYKEYLEARKIAKMIHFAGDQKPWVNQSVDFYNDFYSNIKGTSWELDLEKSLTSVGYMQKIKSKFAPSISNIFPLGSSRRIWLRNAYYKFSSLIK